MNLNIECNPVTCFAAGIEPQTRLNVDLATLSADDRALIARIMRLGDNGPWITKCLDVPTVECLIDTARAFGVKDDAWKKDDGAKRQARIEQLRAAVAARKTIESPAGKYIVGTEEFTTVKPDLGGVSYWDVQDEVAGLREWIAECDAITSTNQEAAREAYAKNQARRVEEAEAKRSRAKSLRENMAMAEIVASMPEKARKYLEQFTADWTLAEDTGDSLRFKRVSSNPKVTITAKVLANYDRAAELSATIAGHDEELELVTYSIDDGVLEISGSGWVAVVEDPSDVKPKYGFLDKVPGGYRAPNVTVGDVLVWGGRDRKGRKIGPEDRLVYAVEDGKIHALKTDYRTARKLRTLLSA